MYIYRYEQKCTTSSVMESMEAIEKTQAVLCADGRCSTCSTIPALQFITSFCLLYSSCIYICE